MKGVELLLSVIVATVYVEIVRPRFWSHQILNVHIAVNQ